MRLLFTSLAFYACVGFCAAQSFPTSDSLTEQQDFKKNNVKINLSSLALNNYSISFERSLSRKTTFAAGYRMMPYTNVGKMAVSKTLADLFLEEDNELNTNLDKATFSNQAFTGELRYYTGKHAGARGFYVAAYGRYTDMKFTYQDTFTTALKSYDLPYKGKLTGIGGGLMVGAQWLIKDRITLDWYIAGGHYGAMGGDINVSQDFSEMSDAKKQELETEVEERFTIGGKRLIDATVIDTSANGKVDAPFAGIRGFGVNVGIAF